VLYFAICATAACGRRGRWLDKIVNVLDKLPKRQAAGTALLRQIV